MVCMLTVASLKKKQKTPPNCIIWDIANQPATLD